MLAYSRSSERSGDTSSPVPQASQGLDGENSVALDALRSTSTAMAQRPLTAPGGSNVTADRAPVYNRNVGLTDDMEYQTSGMTGELSSFQRIYTANAARYDAVANRTGIPATLIAAIHYREGSCNFNTYLHNGDPLGRPTVHVPAGILFYRWEDAAVHALGMFSDLKNDLGLTAHTTDIAAIATFAEYYNGLGYMNRGKTSAYVYSGTDSYQGGMFTSDGHFDANARDRRPGILALINQLGATTTPGQTTRGTPTTTPVPTGSLTGTPMLRSGSSGPQVALLQTALNRNGAALTVDSDFGPRTEAAVRAFQARNHLEVDGVVGPATAAALNRTGTGTGTGTGGNPTPAPAAPATYTVRSGDSLSAIADRLHTTVAALTSLNGIRNPNLIYPGQVLRVPGSGAPTQAPAPVQAPNRPPTTVPPAPPTGSSVADQRGALAARSALMELQAGRQVYGSGTWETRGANQGTYPDKYQSALKAGASSDLPWCGMFVGYNYIQAGIRQEIIDNLVFWSGYRLFQFFQYGKYVGGAGTAGPWWTRHQTKNLDGLTGQARKDALTAYGPQAGDVVLFHSDHSHVAMVQRYDATTGDLYITEGNSGDKVVSTIYGTSTDDITYIGRFNDADFGTTVNEGVAGAQAPATTYERRTSTGRTS
jgi:lysozyme family protein/peptidoglycan hydrolase-like protein with peptidoglycan-binding domain